jgi:hypothetical protein
MREIQSKISSVRLDEHAFDELDLLLTDDAADDEMMVRLEDFLEKQRDRNFGNADELLHGFARSENRQRMIFRSVRNVGLGAWTVTGGALLSVWLTDGPLWAYLVTAFLFLLSVLALIWAARADAPEYLTTEKLRRLQRARDTRTSGGPGSSDVASREEAGESQGTSEARSGQVDRSGG